MKLLSMLLLIVLGFSCKEEVEGFNDLSEAEKEEVRNLASLKCRSESLKPFTEYKEASNGILPLYYRGLGWKFKKGTTATTSTDILFVWKVTPAAVYFLHKYYPSTDASSEYRFIKLTPTVNSQMIDFLREQMCDTDKTIEIKGPPVISIAKYKIPDSDNDVKIERDITNTSKPNQPAFFSRYYIKTTKRTYKTDGTFDVATTEESLEEPVNLVAELDKYPLYNNPQYSGAEFCTMRYIPVASLPNSFPLPFDIKCELSPGLNVNTNGDPAYDFVPSAEL